MTLPPMTVNEGHLLVYCTCPDVAIAEKIANALVQEKHAACVNIVPGLTSVYRWKGQVESATECLLLIKSAASNYHGMEARIVELHPYELPEIIGVPISAGLAPYLAWITHPEEPA